MSADQKDIISADDAMYEILLELARNHKGICPEIDIKIDAAASAITNDKRVTFIAPRTKNAPKVPIYLEGEPGQGKSSITEHACRLFCELVGLNFVEEPPEDYVFKPFDFYYCKVNLSGAQNKTDFGGMMIRTESGADQFMKIRRNASNVGNIILDEAISRAKGVASFINSTTKTNLIQVGIKSFEQGSLDGMEISFSGSDPASLTTISSNLLQQLIEETKSNGVGMHALKIDSEIRDERISYIVEPQKNVSDPLKITIYTPRVADQKVEYASAILPSVRFSKFKQVRFGLVNFDDVANASPNIRNILLEVLQKGRYSGTMDIGNAYVVMSGNKGAEDLTNTMSPMSDAELTRVRKLNVIDTPKDWAIRAMKKYHEFGDCLMGSFIMRQGDVDGIFRPVPGQRGKRGEKKTNGRALENALEVISQHFAAANHAGISVSNFKGKIERDIKDCCGAFVAKNYMDHFQAMVSEAIPMAETLIETGDFDISKFEASSNKSRNTSGKDFCFRFASALGDSISTKIMMELHKQKDSNDQQKVALDTLEKSIYNACKGWSEFPKIGDSSILTYAFSYLSQRLNNIEALTSKVENGASRRLSSDAINALSLGFSDAANAGVWGNEDEINSAQDNFTAAIAGTNLKNFNKKTAKKNV